MTLFSKTSGFKKLLPFAILLFLGLLIYSNVLHGEFVSDDVTYIVTNPSIRNIGDIQAIWTSFNTRFLPGLTFALNYALGRYNVFGYHLFNVFVHILASFLMLQFVRLTFETPTLKDDPLAKESGAIAFLAALIFLTHPIQTQGVSFITQRFASMSTAIYMLTVILYVLARLRHKKRYYVMSLVALITGLFCKENIVTVPITLCVYELFFFKAENKRWWRRFRPVVPFFSSWLVILFIFMQDSPTAAIGLKEQVVGRVIDPNYFFTEINVLRTYLRLFILPVNQIHQYDYPLANGFWEPATVYSFCLLAGLLGLAYYFFPKKRLFSFCILWFFITTSVEFMVVSIANKNLIFEHWLYLPMVGFAFFLAYGMHVLFKNRKRMQWAVVLLITLLSVATYQRNRVWQNELGFWHDAVRKSPGWPAVHFAMGRAWENRGYHDLAMQEYRKALAIKPNYEMAINNMGAIYLLRGDYEKAKEYFGRVIVLNDEFEEVYNNLAYAYYLEGNDEEAVRYYKESIARQGPYPEGYYFMGRSFFALGDQEEAKDSLKKAMDLYLKHDEPEEAQKVRKFLETIPGTL